MLEMLPDAIGHAFENLRAGLEKTLVRSIDLRQGMSVIEIDSEAFADHQPIPKRYTADGEGVSPPLRWTGVPPLASSLVLLIEDADSPTPQPLVHAIVCGLTPGDGALAEGALAESSSKSESMADLQPAPRLGRNSLLRQGWLPPDPPPGHGIHRYVFQLFALGPGAPLPDAPGRDAVRRAVVERGLASGALIGTYERPDGRIKSGVTGDAALASSPC